MECKDFEPSIIQDKRILQLCKRLNKFSLDEIATISEIPADNLLPILNELICENKLSLENNIYSYQKKQNISDQYPIFKYYPKASIDFLLRCFCESIITTKVSHILSIGEPQVQKFYTIFRTLIYERQKNYWIIIIPKSLKTHDTEHFSIKKFIYIFTMDRFLFQKIC